jgi:predicted  nucleic acid-binding Zn-ribbon protein
MAEIINLRQARKQKARTEKEVRAAENRVAFGRTKAAKELTKAERNMLGRRLDSHKRDDEKP